MFLRSGALQLCLQAGAIMLIAYEFAKSPTARQMFNKITRRVAPLAPAAAGGKTLVNGSSQQANMYVDQATGQHFMLVAQDPGWKAATTGRSPGRAQTLKMEGHHDSGTAVLLQPQMPGVMSSTNGVASAEAHYASPLGFRSQSQPNWARKLQPLEAYHSGQQGDDGHQDAGA